MKLRAIVAVSLAACSAHQNSGSGPDAAATPDADTGFTGEAPHGTAPQLVKMTGNVLTAPKVVPIFFQNDQTMQSTIEQFLHQLAGSSYWTAAAHEYGVGDLAVGATIVTSDTPPTTDTALTSWLQGHFNGQNGWPSSPDPQTIYSVFLPAGVVLQGQGGNSCEAYYAYHDELALTGTKKPIIYALMPRCMDMHMTPVDIQTTSLSHELLEAATDPLVETGGAFGNMDNDHMIWAYTPGAEVGDLCEYVDAAYQKLVGNFLVQRSWSNAAAMAGHDPCVPALPGAFEGAAPMLTETMPIDGPGGQVMTKGVQVGIGASKTIDVQFYSDAESGTFTITADDAAGFFGGTPELQLTLDKTIGKNGDVAHLTIKRLATGQSPGSEFVISVKAADNSVVSQWWGFAAN